MIPVRPQPEPKGFDARVRRPGRAWLARKGWDPQEPPRKASDLPPYWREVQKDLWDAYGGVCAYLCVFFSWPLGAQTTDHFVAKSRNAGQAYEWSNYRLACQGMNNKKGCYEDLLDPFEISEDTFCLDPVSGAMSPGPDLDGSLREKARRTIERLRLNDEETRRMRAGFLESYWKGHFSREYLRLQAPFVWYEADRQGLL